MVSEGERKFPPIPSPTKLVKEKVVGEKKSKDPIARVAQCNKPE